MKDDLVARVDVVIADALLERGEANQRGDTNAPTVTDMAKRVLAALGLDDLDAAVERADAANWAKDLYEHTGEESKAAMRDALLAALTVAPEKSDRGSIRACSCGGPETCAIPNDCQRRPR